MRRLIVWSIIIVLAIVLAVLDVSLCLGKWDLFVGVITGLLTGFLTGLVTSTIASLWLSFNQFSSSLAGYRVNKTVEATKEIIKVQDRTKWQDRREAINRHSDSLGVIIDRLDQSWKSGECEEDGWPCLVNFAKDADGQLCLANKIGKPDPETDRWALFDEYVKPVIENINSFSFLSALYLARRFFPESKIRPLSALTELCNQLRVVASEFDAVYGSSLIEIVEVNGKVVIQPVSGASPQGVERLRKAYCGLYKAWGEWLCAVDLV